MIFLVYVIVLLAHGFEISLRKKHPCMSEFFKDDRNCIVRNSNCEILSSEIYGHILKEWVNLNTLAAVIDV